MTKLAVVDIDQVISNGDERFRQAEEAKQAYLQEMRVDPEELEHVTGELTKAIARKATDIYWQTVFTPELVKFDTPIEGAGEALAELERRGWEITLLTSRPERMREATEEWFSTHIASYQIVWGITMKPEEEKFKKTVTWKLERVQNLVWLHDVEELLFVDNEAANAVPVLNWVLEDDCPCQITVCSSLALAVKGAS